MIISEDESDMRETNEIKLHLMDHEKLIYGHIILPTTRELVQQSFLPGNYATQIQRNNREHPGIKTFSKGRILKRKIIKSNYKRKGKCSCDHEPSSKSSQQQLLCLVMFLLISFFWESNNFQKIFSPTCGANCHIFVCFLEWNHSWKNKQQCGGALTSQLPWFPPDRPQ